MSVLSVLQPSPAEPFTRPQQAATPLDDAAPQSWLDTVAAGFRVAKDEVPQVQENRLREAYGPVLQAVRDLNGKSSWAYIGAWKSINPFAGDKLDYDKLWGDIADLQRRGLWKGPSDRATFERDVLERKGARTRDQVVASRGSWSARVVGGIGASVFDPVQVGTALATGGASSGLTLSRSVLAEGLLNAGAAAVEMPATIAARNRLGEQTGVGDAAAELGSAFAFGAAADLFGRGLGAGARKIAQRFGSIDAAPADAVAQAFAETVPDHLRTDDQRAALALIGRDTEVRQQSPFLPGLIGEDAHMARIEAAQRALIDGADRAGIAVRPHLMAGTAAGSVRAPVQTGIDAYLAALARSESGGRANAQAPTSSAYGLYQFTSGTWVRVYRREFPDSGLSDKAILQRRGDAQLQDRLARRLTRDNAAFLERIKADTDPGNLYVVHHLGEADAGRVLTAAPDTPLTGILSERVIGANPFMRDMTAGDFVAWARERMGQDAGPIRRADGGGDAALAAIDAERAAIEGQRAQADAALAAAHTPVPELRRDLFPDEESWRVAQARVEADHLGLAEPRVTWPTIWAERRAQARADFLDQMGADAGVTARRPAATLQQASEALRADIVDQVLRSADGIEARVTQKVAGEIASASAAKGSTARADHAAAVANLDQLIAAARRAPDQAAGAARVAGGVAGGGDAGTIHLIAPFERPEGTMAVDITLRRDAASAANAGPGYTVAGVRVRDPGANARIGSASAGAPEPWRTPPAYPVTQGSRAVVDSTGAPMPAPETVEPVPDAIAARFADPRAADATAQAGSFTHDVAAAIDAGAWADVQWATGDGAAETAAQALAKLDADDAALQALRGCL